MYTCDVDFDKQIVSKIIVRGLFKLNVRSIMWYPIYATIQLNNG